MKTETLPNLETMGVAIEANRDRRALVIDGDAGNRRDICDVLSRKGYEVSACESLREGETFFRAQPLVVAGAGSDAEGGDLHGLIDHIRDSAGDAQPYIITLSPAGNGDSAPQGGANDILSTPIDGASLESKLETAQVWLSARPDKVTGNWEDGVSKIGEAIGGQVGERGAPGLVFDEATAEIALELLDGAGDDGADGEESQSEAEPEAALKAGGGAGDANKSKPTAEATFQVRRGSGKAAELEGPGAASRYHLHLMAEACPLSMAMFNRDMKYMFANSAWRRAFGLAESGLAGRSHFEIFSDVSEKWQLLCERCLAEGDEQSGEELVEWADGACDWVRWLMRPWYFDDGVVGGLVASAQSITGEKRLQREQRFEGDLAEAVMASPTNPVLVLDVNGRIVRSNRAAKRLGRWDPVGEDDKYYWEAFLRKGARRGAQERFMDFARGILDGGEFSFPDAEVEEVVGPDGKARRVVWTNSPRRGEDGEVTGVVRVGFDLERFDDPSKDEALRDSVLQELPVPAWRCNAQGEIDLVNGAWLTLRGRSLEEELGNGWMDGLNEGDIDPLTDLLRAAATDRRAISKVARLAGADGQTRWLRFSAEPQADDEGAVVYGVATDVTAEHELDAARGEADRLEEAAEVAAAKAARFEADLATSGVDLKRLRAETSEAGEERERFRSIPESAPFGIVLLGRDGKTIYCNPAQAEVAGSDIGDSESIEDWLRGHCPEEGEAAAETLVEDWRAKVWRKGATGVYPIRTDEGPLRELEFRPKLMSDGGLLVTIFDVTDTRRGEEALRASEAKFRALFHDSGVGMAMVDRGGLIFDSNPALEALLGVAKVDIRHRGVEEFLSEEGSMQLAELLERLRDGGGRSDDAVMELATADGEPITAHVHVSQVKGADGRVMFTTYFFHDVSEQLRAERVLEDSQAENRAVFGASPDLIVVLDSSWRIVELIPPVDFPLRVDREASLGHELNEVFPEIGVGPADLAAALGGDGSFSHEFRVARDGAALHLELRAARSGSSNTVILVRDVSQVRKAQTKLKWQALTFAHIRDAIVVADMKGRVIDWNPAAENLFGYSKTEAVGLGLHEIYGGDDPAAFRDEFTAAIRGDQRWESRSTFVRSDGGSGQCDAVFVTLQDDEGSPLALVGVNRDADPGEIQIANSGESTSAEPVDAEALAEAASEARGEMQGRLRANLKTVSTLLGLQSHGVGAGADAARAGKARVDALSMLQGHVGEGGDYSEVNFGAYLKELVGELLESEAPEEVDVTVRLHAKGVSLPAGLAMPIALIANELLANALRHGCALNDEISVECAVTFNEEAGRGLLAVKDNGGALPDGFDLGTSSGLGLKIVRGLAERIGGDVQVTGGLETEFRVGFRLPQRG